ncbi:hypothetical protein ACFL6T_05960 [Candidatus Zixiibacteriota bacterium]
MKASRIAVISLISILSGCAPYRTIAPATLLELGPERVLQQAADRAGEVGDLLTSGTILIRSDRGSFSARGVLLFVEPDSLRLDISITLGGIVAQGVIAGGAVHIYMPTEQMVMVGEIGDESDTSYQGMSLDRSVLIEMMLGPALALDWVDLAANTVQYDVSTDHAIIAIEQSDGTRLLLTVGPELDYLRSVRVNRQGEVFLEITYRNYRNFHGARLPQHVVLRYPRDQFELEFDVVNRTADPEYTVEDFILDLPAGLSHVPVYSFIPPVTPR